MKSLIFTILALVQAATPAAPSTPAPAQAPQSERWVQSETRLLLMPAGIIFPRHAGRVSAHRTVEFSRQNEGLDNGIQYRSADGEVVATVYIYLPGLSHAGLADFATDEALNANSPSRMSGGEPRVVAVGDTPGAVIRRDYGNYRNGHASSAAFIKADRWLVKLRVSGPEARRAEVMAAMDALLAGARFGTAARPRPAAPLELRNCAVGSGDRAARVLADPVGPEIAGHVFLATFDGGGPAATNETGARQDLPSRVPNEMCLSTRAEVRGSRIPILRAAQGEQQAIDGQTLLIAVVNDAGELLEVVHAQNLERYWLFGHRVGETALLASFDAVPSDAQIIAVLNGADQELGRVRARVTISADGRQQMFMPGAQAELR